ncbi:MAG: hypothetical protein H0T64_13465, partial [Pyrinomonadaceae bacterium]|nr:hypothetical protein [Pyrinomonadaceae bacterium]
MARYRIMTFDGGGVRGSLMATLVKRLVDLEDVCLLSLGTGLSPTIISLNTKRWGIVQWMLNP